ncbi:MAG: hypothetical protein JSV20_01970 [Candidatus Bathyarchaeota archaeon]|nr:MAG: hypothetical protein JSV20_01970 [Candidatus Bathyarchaeota archaeon]
MSTLYEKKLETLNQTLQKLCYKADQGSLLMVEGRKDEVALRKLGITGEIICVKNDSKGVVDFLDEVHECASEIILLLDFDDYGTALLRKITQYLEGKPIRTNSFFWKKIRATTRGDVTELEGLPSYLEKLKKHVKTLNV